MSDLSKRLLASGKQSSFVVKDAVKFRVANKLISRGSSSSSSHAYAVAAADLANPHNYVPEDTVGISAEGNRRGRLDPDWNEIDLAVAAGVNTFITDTASVRASPYNVGERQVAEYLAHCGYSEVRGTGVWNR